MDRYLFAVRWIPASFSACRQNLKWKIWNWFQFRPIEKLEIFEPAWKTVCFTLNETSRIIALHFLSFSFPFLYESYDISPRKATPFFFFGRPPRRTTRFTDRNEQPAVKVDVESRPPHVSSSRRPALTSVADTRGGKFAEEKGKRSLRAGREYEKKKDSTDTCPVFCVPETVEKRGRRRRRERRRNSRSVIFIAVSDFARLPSLEGHPVFTFRGERSSCPRRGGRESRWKLLSMSENPRIEDVAPA